MHLKKNNVNRYAPKLSIKKVLGDLSEFWLRDIHVSLPYHSSVENILFHPSSLRNLLAMSIGLTRKQ